MDIVDKIIQFEGGEMEANDAIDFFAELVKSGMAWSLQGFYGRTAASLINNGYIDKEGNVLNYPE